VERDTVGKGSTSSREKQRVCRERRGRAKPKKVVKGRTFLRRPFNRRFAAPPNSEAQKEGRNDLEKRLLKVREVNKKKKKR